MIRISFLAKILPLIVLTGCTLQSLDNVPLPPMAESTNPQATPSPEDLRALSHPDINPAHPLPNEIIVSPLVITGEAKGSWFFEAQMPVELQDKTGATIVRGTVQAVGDWINADYVPFRGTLTYVKPATETGYLVIMKDNPSGLPENDASIKIPVTFR